MKSVYHKNKRQWLAVLVAAGALGVCALSSNAALSITNGDFQTGAGNNVDNVTGWFDPSDGTMWHGTWQTDNAGITPNGTAVVVLGSYENGAIQSTASTNVNVGNYLYQSIGTAGSETSLDLTFDWGAPNDDPGGRSLGLTVGVYAYDGLGGFTAAENTDLHDAPGVTLLDSASYTLISSGNDGLIVNVAVTLDLTGAGSQELFLRFNSYRPAATQSWPVLDNVLIDGALPPFEYVSFSPADGSTAATNPPLLEAVVGDWGSEVDSLKLYLDGNLVNTVAGTPGTTTVSYESASPLDIGSHTGTVVVTGINPSASETNSWVFNVPTVFGSGLYIWTTNAPTPGADDQYQFVASMTDSNNLSALYSTNSADIGQWNDGSTYVATDRNNQGQLFTTGNTAAGYELSSVWVRHVLYTNQTGNGTFSGLDAGDTVEIRIVDPAAGTSGFVLHSEQLTVVSNSIAGGTAWGGTGQWMEYRLANPVALNANTQYGFDLTTSDGDAYHELAGIDQNEYAGGTAYTTDGKNGLAVGTVQNGDRTFLVELTATGPTVTPDILSIVVSGGSAVITWDSEIGVNYGVLSKGALTGGAWTEVTNVLGAGASTMATVPAASAQQFFRIEGN